VIIVVGTVGLVVSAVRWREMRSPGVSAVR